MCYKPTIPFSIKTGAGDMRHSLILSMTALFVIASPAAEASEIPAPVAVKGKSIVETVHAQGVQIYECKADTSGKATWQFREPLATLLIDGKTVGRHFAGPSWELDDGSRIKGRVKAQAPGATDRDIPVLLLDVIDHQGNGRLSEVTTVQRLETKGGTFGGSCEKPGALHLEAYNADYVFLK